MKPCFYWSPFGEIPAIINDISHGGYVMEWMGRSDVILMAIGVYVAVMALVRLMRRRRDTLIADVQRQMDSHRQHHKKRHQHTNHDNRGAA